MKMIKLLTVIFAATALVSCNSICKKDSSSTETSNSETKAMKTSFAKKYTNADFYTDGKFNQDVAMKAYKEMFEFYGVPFTENLEKNMWVADFGLGDFENVGMGGIFWINDPVHQYFGHEIYLLPGQMIPEHKHVKTEYPAKFESWMVRHGWAYNFSEVGEATPNAPALPKSQEGKVISKNFVVQEVGPLVELKGEETWHFLYGGDEGAIITEYANYHDGAGLRFSNADAKN